MAEKRRQRRYRKRLLIKFGETDLSQSGFSTDISTTGVFITAPRLVPIGSRIHLQIFFEAEKHAYFEGEVKRHKLVPLKLRNVERGGFGVQFLSPAELVSSAMSLVAATNLEMRFSTKEELQKVFLNEIRVGGIFVATTQLLKQHTDVTLELFLDFVPTSFEFPAKVVHVSTTGVQGMGLVFADRHPVQAALKPFLA